MNRLLFKSTIASMAAVIAAGIGISAFAYTDTTPGAGASASGNPAAGGSTKVTMTFPELAPGTVITFSTTGNTGGCVPQYSAASGTLDANSQVAVTVTFPAGCAGQRVSVIGTAPNGAQVSAAVTVAGGFPNTAAGLASNAPWWLPIGLGVALLVGGLATLFRRRAGGALAAA